MRSDVPIDALLRFGYQTLVLQFLYVVVGFVRVHIETPQEFLAEMARRASLREEGQSADGAAGLAAAAPPGENVGTVGNPE